jgi:hypothetical protein
MTDNLLALSLPLFAQIPSFDSSIATAKTNNDTPINNEFQQLFSQLIETKTPEELAVDKKILLFELEPQEAKLLTVKLKQVAEPGSEEQVLLHEVESLEPEKLNEAEPLAKETKDKKDGKIRKETPLDNVLDNLTYLSLGLNPEFLPALNLQTPSPIVAYQLETKNKPNNSRLVEINTSNKTETNYFPLNEQEKLPSKLSSSPANPQIMTTENKSPLMAFNAKHLETATKQEVNSNSEGILELTEEIETQSAELFKALRGSILESSETLINIPVTSNLIAKPKSFTLIQQVTLQANLNLPLTEEVAPSFFSPAKSKLILEEAKETEAGLTLDTTNLNLDIDSVNLEKKASSEEKKSNQPVIFNENTQSKPSVISASKQPPIAISTETKVKLNKEELVLENKLSPDFKINPLNQWVTGGGDSSKLESANSPFIIKPISQVADVAIESLKQKQSSIKMRLNPDALGQVDIQLQTTAPGEITARLLVESPEALQQLQADLHALKDAFSKQGLTLTYAEVILKGDTLNAQESTQLFSANHSHNHQEQTNLFSQQKESNSKMENEFSQSGFNSFQSQQGGHAFQGQNPYATKENVWDKHYSNEKRNHLIYSSEALLTEEIKNDSKAESLGSRYLFHA